ncbi:MAG: hypothetical protein WD069_08350 [Planctomycetales bacterium]
MFHRQFVTVAVLLSAGVGSTVAAAGEDVSSRPAAERLSISGRYPHLTMFNHSGECGVGAVVPWAGCLWVITYAPHSPKGSDDKLYEIDEALNITARSESVGGTPANRMIHRESKQLFIGPYVVDEERDVRVIPPSKMPGRLTATARHLAHPADKLLHFTMEEGLYEVDVRSLDVKTIHPDGNTFQDGVRQNPLLPGCHGKGAYSGQRRLVVSNNGTPTAPRAPADAAGCLAEWDGTEWRVIDNSGFCEVTGPGGIFGNPPDDQRIWATGWDRRSVLLKLLDRGTWHTFRLPIGDFSYTATNGWYTEWPRIREVAPAKNGNPPKLLMNMHGTWFDFPRTFAAGKAGGLRPIATHLKITGDFCDWNGRIVFGCDDVSLFRNPLANQSQSNLWFTTWSALAEAGPRSGYGALWRHDDVRAGELSDPFLVAGYVQRVVHLLHGSDETVSFKLEVDADGSGEWKEHATVAVPPRGYAWRVLPGDLETEWLRVSIDRDATDVSAAVHMVAAGEDWSRDERLFAPLADIDSEAPRTSGLVRPRGGDTGTLQFAAVAVDAGGDASDQAYHVASADLELRRRDDDPKDRESFAWFLERGRVKEPGFEVDAASVIVKEGARRYRLPKTDPAYDSRWPEGWPRAVREVVTERSLLNVHGNIYVLPHDVSGGMRSITPVCTHSKRIGDFCSWRGLLVVAGCHADAEPGTHFIRSADGKAGLWLGDVDDLWKLGKPRGAGGPWRGTAVKRGARSDPYLMTGFDRKRLALAHDAREPVTFTIEVDFLRDDTWATYAAITVPPDRQVSHEFPPGYSAHWVRLSSNADCTATAIFEYE